MGSRQQTKAWNVKVFQKYDLNDYKNKLLRHQEKILVKNNYWGFWLLTLLHQVNCKQQTSEQTLHCRSSASCFGTLVNSDTSQGLTASFSAEIRSSYSEQMHPKHVLKYDNKFLKRSILHSSDVMQCLLNQLIQCTNLLLRQEKQIIE